MKYQAYLGEEAFVESMREKLKAGDKATLKEVSRLQRRLVARPLKWYEENTETPKQAMVLAYHSGDYSMKEIAEWFGVHYSTVSRAVKLHEGNA